MRMIRRLTRWLLGRNRTEHAEDAATPFEVTLASYNDKWVIVRDGDPMGMAVTREGAVDIALRLTRSLVTDHLDSKAFILHGATTEELTAGLQRLNAWLGKN